MDLFKMLANDPVVIFAFGGMAIMMGICAYYIKHINEDKK